MSTQPTDAELKAMWQIHAADIGGIFYYARAVLAKWGQPAQAAEPVAWLRNTTDPQPHAVTNLKYRSAVDANAGVEYIPVFAAPQPIQARADGFFLLLPQRPKPEAPAGTVGLDWDAYSGAQMLAFGRDSSDAAIAALRTEQPAPAPQPVAREPLTPERVKEIVLGAGYDQCGIPDTERAAFINGLRHGERAHGIKKGGQHGTE